MYLKSRLIYCDFNFFLSVGVILCPMHPDFRKIIAFWKGRKLRPFVLLPRATRRLGMIMEHWRDDTDRENRSTRTETFSSAALFTTKLTQADLGSNASLRVERPTFPIFTQYLLLLPQRVRHRTRHVMSRHNVHVHSDELFDCQHDIFGDC